MQPGPAWIAEVEAAINGDEDAQASVLQRFTPLLRSTAIRLTPAHAVDDVVQQSAEAALRALPRLRTPEAFPSWLRLIVRKEASRVRRGADRAPLDGIDVADDRALDPADAVEAAELTAVVRIALREVNDQDRRLLE